MAIIDITKKTIIFSEELNYLNNKKIDIIPFNDLNNHFWIYENDLGTLVKKNKLKLLAKPFFKIINQLTNSINVEQELNVKFAFTFKNVTIIKIINN